MNDANFPACKHTTDILPYMYGELSDGVCLQFESHLPDCVVCTDAFAEISATRYEVYEWKKLDFDPLPTPEFQIPYDRPVDAAASWIDRLRASFASGWTGPAFALGGLAIVSVLAAILIFSGDKGTNLVSNTTELPSTEDSPRVAIGPVKDVPALLSDKDSPAMTKSTDRPAVVAGADDRITRRNEVRKTVRPARPRSVEVRAQTARKPPVAFPRLNDFEDDEDTSLRLSELLDDIETSE